MERRAWVGIATLAVSLACRVNHGDEGSPEVESVRRAAPAVEEPGPPPIAPYTALHVLDEAQGGVVAVAHGKPLLAVTRHMGRQRLWDLRTSEQLAQLTDLGWERWRVHVAGQHVLAADTGGARLWSLAALDRPRLVLSAGDRFRSVDLSDDGGTFLLHRGERVHVGRTAESSPVTVHEVGDRKSAQLGSDGKVFVTETRRTMEVWAVGADKPTLQVPADSELSPTGPRVLSAQAAESTLWDTSTGKALATVSCRGSCSVDGFSSDGAWAVVIDIKPFPAGTAALEPGLRSHVLDAETGAVILVVDGHAVVSAHAIASPADGEVVVRTLPAGDEVGRMPAGQLLRAVSAHGHYVFQAERENGRLWDVRKRKPVPVDPFPHGWEASFGGTDSEAVVFDPRGANPAALVRLADGNVQAEVGGYQFDRPVTAFSPSGKLLAVGGRGPLTLVAVADGATHACAMQPSEIEAPVLFVDEAHVLYGAQIFAVGAKGTCEHVADVATLGDTTEPVSWTAGTALIPGERDGENFVQSVNIRGETQDVMESLAFDLAVTPEGRVVVGVGSRPPVLRGGPRLDAFEAQVESQTVAVSPDGAFIATAGWSGWLWIVDVAEWKVVGTIRTGSVRSPKLAFLGPRRVVLSFEHGLKVYDVESEAIVFETETVEKTSGFAVDPRGRFFAFGGEGPCKSAKPGPCLAGRNYPVTLLNPETFEPIAELDSHQRIVDDIAISPTGTHLASAASDNRVVIWSLPHDEAH